MTKRTRRLPADRKADLLNAALDLARRHGYQKISSRDVAQHSGVSQGLVMHYFGTMRQLQRAIISAAVAREDLAILAQGLASGEAKVRALGPEMKQRIAAHLIGG